MLVELDLKVTYTVRGEFEMPETIAKQLDFGEQPCPSDFTEWCADNIDEELDGLVWEYDIQDFELLEEKGGEE